MIVRMALDGLNSSSAAFRAHLSKTLNDIGLISTKTEPDVWYRPEVTPEGFEYYDYILYYVDDILCISHDPGIALGWIQAVLKFKVDKMEQPKYISWGLSRKYDCRWVRRLVHVCREVC